MDSKHIPIIYINLGGEMFYVLYLRLKSLECSNDRIEKVLSEMAAKMFSEDTLNELFEKTKMEHSVFKAIYNALIGSSAITIPSSSMNTLYDLMTMVFKYQVFCIKKPEHLLLITLNHMDKMRSLCWQNDEVKNLFMGVHKRLMQNYSTLNPEQFKSLYTSVTSFFEDLKIKVSVLIKEGKQGKDGEFIIDKENDNVSLEKTPSLDFEGDRIIPEGTNIYDKSVGKVESVPAEKKSLEIENFVGNQDPKYKAEVDYLMGLVGTPKNPCNQITLNLGDLMDDYTENEDIKTSIANDDSKSKESNVKHFRAEVHTTGHLSKIIKEMKVDKKKIVDDPMQYFD